MQKLRTPIVVGQARFTVFAPGCVRLEYAHGGAFSEGPSLLVGSELPIGLAVEGEVSGSTLHLRTSQFELRYTDNGASFSPANLQIQHRDAQGRLVTWVPGKKDTGNLGTVTRSLDQWKWCGGPQHYPVEGVLSTDGGHLVLDEPRVYWNKKHGWPECRGHAVVFDGYFFAYGNDYKSALRDFVTVFGRIPMVPRWAFGFWYSRWYAYNEREILDLVRRYRRMGAPLDVMVIDTDWRDGWGGYDWSRKYFPNPERLLKKLHAMGCHVGLNDHPGYDNYDGLPAHDSHLSAIEKRLGPLPHQGQWACDWSNKKAVQAWKDILLGPFFDQGLDFWWVDGWLKPPFVNVDSQLWANQHYYDLAKERTRKRGLILSRWGGVGSHRYPVQFSGDTPSEWEMLRHQIEFTARSGNLAAVYWSHDIGGFFGRHVDEELFIRWFQFGSMSPIFRTHSDHGDREPWKYSATVRRLFVKQTRIRYALAPYWYTLAWEAHTTGLPIVRPLYLEYNDNDGGALWRKHQYMIGRDLLVIPADAPVDRVSKRLRKRAYFPNGTWIGLETDEMIHGMLDGNIEIPLERIPTYVRQGAIIPSQPVGDFLGTKPPNELHLDYYPDLIKPSEYTLYEDDGESREYERGRYMTTRIEGCRRDGGIEVTICAAKGSYAGAPARRRWVVRIAVPESDRRAVSHAEVQTGDGKWKRTAYRITKKCLAGEVASGRWFAEMAVIASVRDTVRCRFVLR